MAFTDLHEIQAMFSSLEGCLEKRRDSRAALGIELVSAPGVAMANLREERKRQGLRRTRAGGHDRWVPATQPVRRRGRQPTVGSLTRKSKIMELLASGMTTYAVAEAVGVHQSYVSRVRTRAKLTGPA